LVTDQGAVLAIRAAARGVVDFSKARLRDPRWYRYVRLVLEAMRSDDDIKQIGLQLAFSCALVGNGSLTEGSFKEAQKTAHELVHTSRNILFPWAAVTLSEAKKRAQDEMIGQYKAVLGDPSDPKFMAALRAEIEAYEVERKKPQPLDDVEKIDLGAKRRDARYAMRP
jgi:hypothetical protein